MAFIFTAPSALADGPFGITLGDAIDQHKECKATSDAGFYKCDTVPRPYKGFESYFVESWPDIGICRISAFSSDTKTGDTGNELRSATDQVAYDISSIYGKNEKFNFSAATKYPDIDPYWMLHLENNDQHYAYAWSKKTHAIFKNGVEEIMVMAKASSLNSGYVLVTFWSVMHIQCVENENKERAKAF